MENFRLLTVITPLPQEEVGSPRVSLVIIHMTSVLTTCIDIKAGVGYGRMLAMKGAITERMGAVPLRNRGTGKAS